MTMKIFACVGAAVILWGCAIGPRDGSLVEPCADEICQVDVYVSGTPPVITVNKQTLTLRKGNYGRNDNGVLILWVLKESPGYTFREDSIQFYDPNSPQQFDDPKLSGAGAQFHWRDQNRDGLTWGYQIKVYDRRTGVWTPLDPWIQNG